MKLNLIKKIILPTTLISITAPIPFLATGCSQSVDWTDDSCVDFIYKRTFCLRARSSSGSSVSGTMWILSDSTPKIKDDFNYWCLTNNHVIHEMQHLGTIDNLYVAQNASTSGFSGNSESFCKIGWSAVKIEDISNSEFNPPAIEGIDLSILNVNLTAAATSTYPSGTPMYPIMKSNLEELNKFNIEKGCITPIAQTVSSDKNYSGYKAITGGYPVDTSAAKYKWESRYLNAGELQYTLNRNHYDETAMDVKDVSPNYFCRSNKRINPSSEEQAGWMDGGASGSMLLSKIDNEFKVIGIYWGGFSTSDNKTYFPSFSIFNSDKKNFVQKYK